MSAPEPAIGDEVRFDYDSAPTAWTSYQRERCNHTGVVIERDNLCSLHQLAIERITEPLLGEVWRCSAASLIVTKRAADTAEADR